jgi:Leucine-rich repeat (LRR) protein
MSKKSLSALIEEARKSKATVLDLSGEGLSQLPESLGQLSQLQQLRLDGNQLAAVPEMFPHLTSLQELYLHGNKALGLPMEVLGSTRQACYSNKPSQPSPVTFSSIISVCGVAGDR